MRASSRNQTKEEEEEEEKNKRYGKILYGNNETLESREDWENCWNNKQLAF
jgi:hypothetical protein